MSFIDKLFIKFSSKKIGEDEFGNQYFLGKTGKRFVIYNGIAEASKVPFEWHGWLHYSTNNPPVKVNTGKFSWQKIHLPNLTGTKGAYCPKNSKIKTTNSNYEAWKPSE
jgi:NADH:ubiquinone oxidoreductase subunit